MVKVETGRDSVGCRNKYQKGQGYRGGKAEERSQGSMDEAWVRNVQTAHVGNGFGCLDIAPLSLNYLSSNR